MEIVVLGLVLSDSPWLNCAVECKVDTVGYSLRNTFMNCARSIMVDAYIEWRIYMTDTRLVNTYDRTYIRFGVRVELEFAFGFRFGSPHSCS